MTGISHAPVAAGVTAHGALTGLLNDDHTMYELEAALGTDVAAYLATIMTTRGDLLAQGVAGALTRLAAAPNSSFVVAGGLTPAFVAIATVLGTLLTTRGDLVTVGAGGVTRLAHGSVNQVLGTDGTDALWSAIDALVTFAAAVAPGTANSAGSGTTFARANHVHKLLGAAIQSVAASTGAVASGATADVAMTWPTAFADTNYKIQLTATLSDATARTPSRCYVRAETITASGFTARFINDAAVSLTWTINALGVHD